MHTTGARRSVAALVLLAALACSAVAGAQGTARSADAVLAALAQATWITDGAGRHAVYVFFDPNCPSCALLYRNTRALIAPHDLQLRWVPVAIVNATSAGKAAAILEAADPSAALRENKEAYSGELYAGGIAERIAADETERRLRANEALLEQLDIPVVPSMLFLDRDRRTVLIQGALSPLALRKVFDRLR